MTSIVHVLRHRQRRYKPRQYVQRGNFIEQYSNDELYARFRFRREDILYICEILRPHLQRPTRRSHALTVEEQVLIALRFFACGSFYEVIADGLAVTKSTVGHVMHSVAAALAGLIHQYVRFPDTEEEITQTKRKFFSIARMPNTIGAIDCTHIHIQAPHEREWEFVNRKGRHSINVQLIGNADLKITNCVVRWPGSVHDARILRESHLYRRLQQTAPDGILLGDSGYPLLRWLMTPFATVTCDPQQRYNNAHIATRGTIERINGVLKRRFACLNYLRVEPKQACNIISACIVLHNIAQLRRVPLNEDILDRPPLEAEVPQLQPPPPPHQADEPAGRAVRNAMVNLYFS